MEILAPDIKELSDAVISGQRKKAVEVAQSLLQQGVSVEELIRNGLVDAIQSLDIKCTNDEFNLLEIMLSGRAMMMVMDDVVVKFLKKEKQTAPFGGKTMVLGTIQGDIHELGKHIARTLFMTRGFRVIDLGKDVAPESFVSMAIKEKADYIAVSSLITLTYPNVQKIKTLLEAQNIEGVKVIAGGAALQQGVS